MKSIDFYILFLSLENFFIFISIHVTLHYYNSRKYTTIMQHARGEAQRSESLIQLVGTKC